MTRKALMAGTAFAVLAAIPAVAQTVPQQSGSAGGLNYITMTSPDGCSSANPCQIITYLHYLGGEGGTPSDLNTYFNNSQFWNAHPHTVIVAPLVNGSSDDNNWGGVQSGVSSNMQAAVAAVKQVEASQPTNPNTVVLTGGSMGGIGTEAGMEEYGPKGTTGDHVFASGLAYDGAIYNSDPTTERAALCGVPLTIQHGTADNTVPIAPDNSLASALSGCSGFTYTQVQGAGHGTWNDGYETGTQLDQMAAAAAGNPVAGGAVATSASGTTIATPIAASGGGTSLTPTSSATNTSTPTTAAAGGQTITPGSGSITDKNGNVWTITANGSIREGDQWTPGGGGTSALTIGSDGTVYGEDDSGKGWFTLSGNGQLWSSSAAPSGTTQTTVAATSLPPTASSAVVGACGGIASGTKAFGVLPTVAGGAGQIFDPNGKPYIAHGFDIGPQDMQSVAASIGTFFPGANFIRLAVPYDSGTSDQDFQTFATAMAARGTVVEIEDHPWPAANPYTGQQLAAESAWYAHLATIFKDNPYVWFGAMNEPQSGYGADEATISTQQQATYNAIRGTGSETIIMMEAGVGAGNPGTMGEGFGFTSSTYAAMTNIVWDYHFYNWVTHFSTDQGTVDAALAGDAGSGSGIAAAQTIKSAGGVIVPVIIGEFGNSSVDNMTGGTQVITAVLKNGVGYAAWEWTENLPDQADALIQNGSLTPMGKQVAAGIEASAAALARAGGSVTSACTTAQAATPTNQATNVAAVDNTATTQPDGQPVATDAITTAKEAAQTASTQADTQSAAADAQLAAIQAQIASMSSAATTPSLKAVGAP